MTVRGRFFRALLALTITPLVLVLITAAVMRGMWIPMAMHRTIGPMARPPIDGGLLFVLAVVAALLSINGLISYHASRHIVRPLDALRRHAEQLGAGNLDQPLIPSGDSEVYAVMSAFEQMRLHLRDSLHRQLATERTRGELIAALSHDLRTPATAIRGYIEGLRDGIARTPADQERYLTVIHERALYLERLLDDLFAFSRVEYEGLRIQPEPIDLSALIADLAAEFSGRIALTLNVLAPDQPLLHADRHHLRRALTNIFDNAAKYAGPPPVPLELKITRQTGLTRLEIADHGPGVGAAALPHLFDSFYRADPSRPSTTAGGGTSGSGLGLAVVRQVLTAHRGRAAASHTPGGGLTITLEFPNPEQPNR